MPEDSVGGGGMALDDAVLDAKLSIPTPRSGWVSRSEIIASARGSDCRVVGVTAPAGYGKSTLLAEWAGTEDRPVGWAGLDRFDDDPVRLLSLLAAAFARAVPERADVVPDVTGMGMSVLGRAAPRLASAFRTAPTPFVVMVDDLHEVQSPACHDALGVTLAGIPPGSQLVTASRSEQPHLSSLRASGDALELGVDALALDALGAERIFSSASVHISADAAAMVTERTEGWPVGLYLAAMIARDGGGEAAAISGDDRYVADYLYRESLQRLPDEDQRFLRQTAVLDHLCAPLCEAVVGEQGAQERLRRLESSNHFLVPLDRRREWYRYHALFREFLVGELGRIEPDALSKLHIRAADWYEANGSAATALEHLLKTSERERCAHLLTALVEPTHVAGQTSTVFRWLGELGDEAVQQYPPLAVLAGWEFAMNGQPAEADRWAAFVDAASFEEVPLDGSASFASARAMLRSYMCASGPEQALADADFAVHAEPPWSPWRELALAVRGEALLLMGDAEEARRAFDDAIGAGARGSDNFVVCESELGLLDMDRGGWSEASSHVQAALDAIDEHRMGDYSTSVLAFAAAARLALHRGDLPAAQRELARAMRARPACTVAGPAIAVRVRLQLAKVYLALTDHSAVRHLLREIDDLLRHRPALGALVDEVVGFQESVTNVQAGPVGATPLSPAELRLLPYLQTHLMMREIAERLFVSRNTVSSQVSSIYRKLGVSSRHEAVEHATAMGLLGA